MQEDTQMSIKELEQQRDKLEKTIAKTSGKLNPSFLEKAPPHIVEQFRNELADQQEKLKDLVAKIEAVEQSVESGSDKKGKLVESDGAGREARLEKVSAMLGAGVTPYAFTYKPTSNAAAIRAKYSHLEAGEEDESADVAIAGRIMAKRAMGKLAFLTVKDDTGIIQVVGDKAKLLQEFDTLLQWTHVGDFIGARGSVKKTNKGELSVYAGEWTMLSKSLLNLPDKFHGLTDVETRYRQRHLDMIMNPGVKEKFRLRSRLTAALRRKLDESGFLEIETPVLHDQPGGAEAKPFETYYNALEQPMTLRIATELHLKRLIIGGFERVYELGRIFRNEGLSIRHNPEFTSVELYQAYADYNDMMDLTERLISEIAVELLGTTVVAYGGHDIDLTPPWRRDTMHGLVEKKTGIDFADPSLTLEDARSKAQLAGVPKDLLNKCRSVGEVVSTTFEELCEADLIQPTFVLDHPVEISPLAKSHRSKPGLTERFELFINGRELANAYSELNDPVEQRRRFEMQAAAKAAGNDEACGVDEDFLLAMEQGMPPTGGLGIGIDRLAMLLTNATTIRDVIAFPQLRRESR